MNSPFVIVVTVLALGALFVFLPGANRFRYKKVVRCPETDQPAEIVVDASPTLSSGQGRKNQSIRKCSLWPKKKGCTQNCLT